MKLLRILGFSLLLLVHGGLLAQDPTELVKPQNGQAELSFPQPRDLRPDWWRYFEVEPDQLVGHIDKIAVQLEEVITELPKERIEVAERLLYQFLVNLRSLAKLRTQEKPQPPIAPTPKKSYTTAEWLILERQSRSRQQEVREEKGSIDQLAGVASATEKSHDNLLASYLSGDKAAPTRLQTGLELMVGRSALELARLKLQQQRQGLSNLELKLEFLLQEKEVAASRLQESVESLESLAQAISKQQMKLEQATNLLNGTRSRSLQAVDDTTEALIHSRYQEQQVIHATVNESLAQLELAILEVRKAFVRLLAKGEFDAEKSREQVTLWQRLSRDVQLQAEAWQARTQLEQNRAQGRLLAQPEPVGEMREINENRFKLAQDTLLSLRELDKLRRDLRAFSELYRLNLAREVGGLRSWWVGSLSYLQEGWTKTAGWFSGSLFKIGETPVTLFGILRVCLILVVAWTASKLLRRALARIAARKEGGDSALYTVGRLAHYVILVVGLMVALSSIGLDFSNLALVAGALSVGIGFGLQSIVNNFVSGLILLFEGSLKVGDYVELDSGVRGEVKEINVRSTLVNTNDNIDIIVPNSELVAAKVTNWTLRDTTRRVHVPFGVAYGTDKELVKEAALKAANSVSFTMHGDRRDPEVWLVGFGESSLDFELLVWVCRSTTKRPSSVLAAYLWELETQLAAYGIEIPFPQRDLHIKNLPARDAVTPNSGEGDPVEGIKL